MYSGFLDLFLLKLTAVNIYSILFVVFIYSNMIHSKCDQLYLSVSFTSVHKELFNDSG